MKHAQTGEASPTRRLLARAADMGVPLPPADAGRLVAILDRMAQESQNLTAIEDVYDGVDRHLADSLAGLTLPELADGPHLRAGGVCDIGSGGGLPGLVIAMMRPNVPVTLVESEARKCEWLRRASAGLPNVRVVTDRSETFAREARETFATVTARAVAPPPSALELAAPLVAVGGDVVLWVADIDPAGREATARAAALLGMSSPREEQVRPFPGARRRLLVAHKHAPTPSRFPRRPGRAVKRPIA